MGYIIVISPILGENPFIQQVDNKCDWLKLLLQAEEYPCSRFHLHIQPLRPYQFYTLKSPTRKVRANYSASCILGERLEGFVLVVGQNGLTFRTAQDARTIKTLLFLYYYYYYYST